MPVLCGKTDMPGNSLGDALKKVQDRSESGSGTRFITFESRGGDYHVVADAVVWLRKHEDGQVKIGLAGGEMLQVVGSVDEIKAKLSGEA